MLWRTFTLLTENRCLLPIYLQAILLSPTCLRLHILLFSVPCLLLTLTFLPHTLKCHCGQRLQNLPWTLHTAKPGQLLLLLLLHLLFLGNGVGSVVFLSLALTGGVACDDSI